MASEKPDGYDDRITTEGKIEVIQSELKIEGAVSVTNNNYASQLGSPGRALLRRLIILKTGDGRLYQMMVNDYKREKEGDY